MAGVYNRENAIIWLPLNRNNAVGGWVMIGVKSVIFPAEKKVDAVL
jgi:hypothetical protein